MKFMKIHKSGFLVESVNKSTITRRDVIDQLEYTFFKTRTFFQALDMYIVHIHLFFNAHIIC
jgi:hypothetical protein